MRIHCLHILCSSEMSTVFLGWTKAKPTKQALAFLRSAGLLSMSQQESGSQTYPMASNFSISCSQQILQHDFSYCCSWPCITAPISLTSLCENIFTIRKPVQGKRWDTRVAPLGGNSKGKVGGLRLPEATWALPTRTWKRTVEVSLYTQNHWAQTNPLLASKDIFCRHLKKTDTHFPSLAVSLICKVPFSVCSVSGMGKLTTTQGSAERPHYWEDHWMLQLQKIGLVHCTNAWWDPPERRWKTVTTAFLTQQFDWISCWINHESNFNTTQLLNTHGLIH